MPGEEVLDGLVRDPSPGMGAEEAPIPTSPLRGEAIRAATPCKKFTAIRCGYMLISSRSVCQIASLSSLNCGVTRIS